MREAGLFAEGKVNAHNRAIENSKTPPYDITVASVETKHGTVRYVTCRRERDFVRKSLENRVRKFVKIENYPTSDFRDIPYEAQRRLKAKKDKKWDAEPFAMN